jgi:hypothetical protein
MKIEITSRSQSIECVRMVRTLVDGVEVAPPNRACVCDRRGADPAVFLCDACDAAICSACDLELDGGRAMFHAGGVSMKTIGHYVCSACRAGVKPVDGCPCPRCRGLPNDAFERFEQLARDPDPPLR